MVEQMTYDRSAASFRVWEFAGNADGFTAVGGGSKATAANSVLTFTAGTGGYLASPAGLNIPAEAVRTVTFRLNESGALAGFAGAGASSITIDGKTHVYFSEKAEVMFNEMESGRIEEGVGKVLMLRSDRPGTFTLPLPEGFSDPKAGACRFGFVETDREIPCSVENGMLTVPVTENEKNLYIAVYQPA